MTTNTVKCCLRWWKCIFLVLFVVWVFLFLFFVFVWSSSCVLCTQLWQFLWIVHCWLLLRFTLTLSFNALLVLQNISCDICFRWVSRRFSYIIARTDWFCDETVQGQHYKMGFYSASSLKQQSGATHAFRSNRTFNYDSKKIGF